MRAKSHQLLGNTLCRTYLSQISIIHRSAFLLGCIQPDWNPATYLKGSLQWQFLRGHNYGNTLSYRQKLLRTLEQKETHTILDCYKLGKLIHYTADAFTAAHNLNFPRELKQHRAYEQSLHLAFSRELHRMALPSQYPSCDIQRMIGKAHSIYSTLPRSIYTDSHYAFTVCCNMLMMLTGSNQRNSSFADGPNVLGVTTASN